jgi:Double-stranded RNA binding motif
MQDEVAPGGASFVSICTVGENVKGEGQASTKKVAKKLAAAEALKSLTEFLKSRLGEKLSSDEVDFKKLTRLFTKFNVEDNNTTNTNTATTTSNVKFASLEDKLLYFRDCVGPKVDLLTVSGQNQCKQAISAKYYQISYLLHRKQA